MPLVYHVRMIARCCPLIALLLLTACAAPQPVRDRGQEPESELEPETPVLVEPDPAEEASSEALAALRNAVEEPGFQPETALALLLPLPTGDLRELHQRHAREARLSPWLDLAASVRPHVLDDANLAKALRDWANRHPRAGYYPGEAREWIQAWRDVAEWPGHIAVLLPGAGPLTDAGTALRDGMLARWLTIPPEYRPVLEFLQLPPEPHAAAGARFEAQARGADMIIGPLDRRQIDALLAQPGTGIPMLLLNQPDDPGTSGHEPELVYFLALPPEEEAEQAAVHALDTEHRGAILLEEDSAWGRRVGDAFSSSFEAGGGRVVERRRFDSSEADHSSLLESALGFRHSAERAGRLQSALGRQLNYEAVMRADADFVFLAGRDQDIRLIKPQLTYVGAGHLPVFGTSRLYAGLRGAGQAGDLNGVEFPIAPWFVPGLPQGEAGSLAQARFPNLDNPTFSQLHALGRDALGLIPWLDYMSADPELYLPGMTGRLRLSGDGRVERRMPWVRFDGNAIRLIRE